MIIAGAITFLLPAINPFLVGLSVALAASIAKTGHYYIASYVGSKAGNKTEKLQSYGRKLGRWGALAAFVAAATPIPDDPIVIPLGLARYSPIKFFVAYFVGKALISIGGAYLGQRAALTLENLLPTNEYIALTVVLSIVLVVVLVKVDLSAVALRLSKAARKN
jgi:membrane protein DedA with SNARE-associated domain